MASLQFPADIEECKELLDDFVKNETDFSDYNIEGSGTSQVNNILSYNSQQISFYLNMILNDLFITTAKTESSIYKLAKVLNYIPRRKSASYVLTTFSTDNDTVTIPKFTKFKIGDVAITNKEDIYLTSGTPLTVKLYEGEVVTEIFQATGAGFERFYLANREDIDDQIFEVYVDTVQSDGTFFPIKYLNANESDFDIDGNNYYLYYLDHMSIKFDDGVTFNKPKNGDNIRFQYLKTSGAISNGLTGDIVFDGVNPVIGDFFDIEQNAESLQFGSDQESLESIKTLAPLFYTTQGRAVNRSDWKIILNRYEKIDLFRGVNVWSGAEEYIDSTGELSLSSMLKDLGHAEISVLVKGNDPYLTTLQKNDLSLYIDKRKPMTIFPRYIDPVLITQSVTANINFISELNNPISITEESINNFLDSIQGFEKSYKKSNIVAYIDDIPDVNYVTIDLLSSFTINNSNGIGFYRLFNEIVPGSLSLTGSGFSIADDGAGILELTTGGTVSIGTVDYTNGIIEIDQTNAETTDILTFDVEFLNKEIIKTEREVFMDYNDITINSITI